MERTLGSSPGRQAPGSRCFYLATRRWPCLIRKSLAAAILSLFASVTVATGSAVANAVPVRVMTQNLYLGSDLSLLATAKTPAEFIAAVTQLYQNILASNTNERAAAVAQEIARERPDLVALQEAWILRNGVAPATNVVLDQLEALLAELRRIGHPYEAVAILPNLDAEAPTLLGFDARLTDRTVIIARAELRGPHLRLANMRVQDYLANSVFNTTLGVPLVNKRGWASVDATVFGNTFRLVTTHFDLTPPFAIQRAQAAEAVKSVTATRLPIVFVGDFNVVADVSNGNPTFPTYQLLINAGFGDAWREKHPSLPGFTCCQAPDLLNPVSALDARIDLMFTRGAVSVQDIELVGDRPSERTASGRWPSDHAGLAATLRIGN